MSKESLQILKNELRKEFLLKRKSLPETRRLFAAKKIRTLISKSPYEKILSFSSTGSEIDLSLLNEQLRKEKRLFLPRVEKKDLSIYQVNDETTLVLSSLGILEPDLKSSLSVENVDVILVPAIAFDSKYFRLGYGGGFYDRLLARLYKIPTLGVGFEEQLSSFSLPQDPWDLPLKQLCLV